MASSGKKNAARILDKMIGDGTSEQRHKVRPDVEGSGEREHSRVLRK